MSHPPADPRTSIAQMPKVELHLHLEGAIRPETMLRIFQRHGNPSVTTLEEARRLFVHRSFREFLEHYKELNEWLKEEADIELAARELMEDLAAQNVRYVEVTVSPGTVEWLSGLQGERVLAAAVEGLTWGGEQHGVRWRIILDLVRNLGVERGWEMARTASRWRDRGVGGITLGGNETDFPASPYAEIYAWARDQGLLTTAHAGEGAGADSVWDCVRLLKVDRIGHGTRMVEDPALIRYAVERGIHVECCPTSNVETGVVSSPEEHPVRRLHDAGVRLGINTDDPALFRTTLTQELEGLHRVHKFSPEELYRLQLQAAESAIDPEAALEALQAGQLPSPPAG